jgi:hypothetical protein
MANYFVYYRAKLSKYLPCRQLEPTPNPVRQLAPRYPEYTGGP